MTDLSSAKQSWTNELRGLDPDTINDISAAGLWIAIGAICTIVLSPFGICLLILWLRNRSKRRLAGEALLRRLVGVLERSNATLACPAMVNSMLRTPGDEVAPGLFLVRLDGSGLTAHQMADIAERLDPASEEHEKMSQAGQAFAMDLFMDEEYRPHRRRRLPAEVAGEGEVYACDMVIDQGLLAGGCISDEWPFVPAVVEPGAQGRILMMPWWYVAERSTPDEKSLVKMVTILMLLDLTEEAMIAAGHRNAPTPPPLPGRLN